MTLARYAFTICLALAAAAPFGVGAQEQNRMRPDERLRPAPTERPAMRDKGPAYDPTIDDPKAIEQQDLVTRCRPAGAPTSAQTGGGLPSPAKTEPDSGGDCLPAPSGQPLGTKAVDKLMEQPTKR